MVGQNQLIQWAHCSRDCPVWPRVTVWPMRGKIAPLALCQPMRSGELSKVISWSNEHIVVGTVRFGLVQQSDQWEERLRHWLCVNQWEAGNFPKVISWSNEHIVVGTVWFGLVQQSDQWEERLRHWLCVNQWEARNFRRWHNKCAFGWNELQYTKIEIEKCSVGSKKMERKINLYHTGTRRH